MSAPFTLDTSGSVFLNNGFPYENAKSVTWEDLTPFAQGYIEALFAGDIYHVEGIMIFDKKLPRGNRFWAFSDLSPEALATILANCQRHRLKLPKIDADDGRNFWAWRQQGLYADAGFPPLTVFLADDGKIHLKAAA